MIRFTLDQLRVFLAVAEAGHVTRAGETLGLSQSGVSAALAALQDRHQVRLFDRIGRGLRLSEAGRLFAAEARAVLARAEAADALLSDLSGVRRGVLSLAASQTLAAYWLPPRLARFAADHPALDIRMRVGNTRQVIDWIVSGEAELGAVEGRYDADGLVREEIGEDRLRIAAAPARAATLRRAAGGAVDREALIEAEWVMREPGSGTRSELEAALASRGVDPSRLRVRLELPTNEAVLAAAASGDLLSGASELALAPFLAAGLAEALPFDLASRRFALARRARDPLSGPAAAFREVLRPDPPSTVPARAAAPPAAEPGGAPGVN